MKGKKRDGNNCILDTHEYSTKHVCFPKFTSWSSTRMNNVWICTFSKCTEITSASWFSLTLTTSHTFKIHLKNEISITVWQNECKLTSSWKFQINKQQQKQHVHTKTHTNKTKSNCQQKTGGQFSGSASNKFSTLFLSFKSNSRLWL